MTAYPLDPPAGAARPLHTGRARVALILAIVVVAVSLAQTLFVYLLPVVLSDAGLSSSSVPGLLLPFQLAEIVLAVVALILAIGPLAGAGPRGVAGIAAGAAGTVLVTTVFGLAVGPVLSLVL